MKNFPDHFKKLEELKWEYCQDFPIPDGIEHTRPPFDRFIKLTNDFYENCYGADIVAVFKGKYIGSTDLEIYPKSEPHKAWTDGLGSFEKL